MAECEDPERVVALLNDFFAAVVDVVDANGGLVNKFEGDAALCVFGAPVALERPRGRGAARGARAPGPARARSTAGWRPRSASPPAPRWRATSAPITRFEYTVVGDPVNEAARLSDAAKTRPMRLLASAAALERAGRSEAARWRAEGELRLRGRSTPTRLAVPVGAARLVS